LPGRAEENEVKPYYKYPTFESRFELSASRISPDPCSQTNLFGHTVRSEFYPEEGGCRFHETIIYKTA
jgi:hypothetical protein